MTLVVLLLVIAHVLRVDSVVEGAVGARSVAVALCDLVIHLVRYLQLVVCMGIFSMHNEG